MTDVETTVRRILASHLKVDPERMRGEDRLREDLGADSLHLIEVVFEFEETFNLCIPDDQVANIRTLDDILLVLQSAKSA